MYKIICDTNWGNLWVDGLLKGDKKFSFGILGILLFRNNIKHYLYMSLKIIYEYCSCCLATADIVKVLFGHKITIYEYWYCKDLSFLHAVDCWRYQLFTKN